MAWLRAFFHKSEMHSWFFNFHDKTPFTFPIWFYDWGTMLGCSPSVLPCEAKEGWDFSIADTPPMKPIQKKYNSSESPTLPRYSIGNIDIRIIFLIYLPCLLSESARSDVEWIQNQTLWKKKCWVFQQNKNQKLHHPKHSDIRQNYRTSTQTIHPYQNGSLFLLYKIQIQWTNTKRRRYPRSPQRWSINEASLFTKAPWQWRLRW